MQPIEQPHSLYENCPYCGNIIQIPGLSPYPYNCSPYGLSAPLQEQLLTRLTTKATRAIATLLPQPDPSLKPTELKQEQSGLWSRGGEAA